MSNFRIYNDVLCPDIWDSAQHLRPKIRANLLQIAYDFYEKTDLPSPIIDVYLIGSSANYNWTPDSDVDVHVIIDYSKLQIPPDPAFEVVKTAGAQWNSEHNIFIKGHEVEMNIQNSAEQKPHVTGIYSLIKDQWIRTPVKTPFQLDKQVLKVQYEAMKNYVATTIASGDREKMKSAKKYLDTYRQYGLDTYGELSYENIIYKMLRARGHIKQLKDSIIQVYDAEFTVDEVGERDIKQIHPYLSASDHETVGNPKFDRSYWDKNNRSTGNFDISRLTLDELKALREKARRMYLSASNNENQWRQEYRDDFKLYSDEIKRRLGYINSPITESPMMSNDGSHAMAGDKPLKQSKVEDVYGNIVVIRQPSNGGFFPEGYTLVYFMDSDEAAESMSKGDIPYLMVPRGTFMGGGSPITDIWKKKFQKPGTEHILGVIEGSSLENTIFIDMITVRPGWKRNHIAKLMIDRLKKSFPKAKLTTSTQTFNGEKFFDKYGTDNPKKVKEGVGSGIPEDDRLKIDNTDGSVRRWQVRSKDAPKTPKFTGEEVIAVPKFDNPQEVNEDMDPSAPSIPPFPPTDQIDPSYHARPDLFPQTVADVIPPDIKKLLSVAERVLDNKSITRPFFEEDYVEDLLGDILASEYP